MKHLSRLALLIAFLPVLLWSQITAFPWREAFDTARVPLLPAGWSTSTVKSPSGDFTTTLSTPFSAPACAIATDARVRQQLISPVISLAGRTPEKLEFFERRSSTFTSGLLVEASCGDDTLSWLPLSDTLVLMSSSAYVRRTLPMPAALGNQARVRLRWRSLGNGAGATGTLRIDEITLSVVRAVDLALDTIVILPAQPINAGSDAACIFTIRNAAREGTYAWSLTLADSARDAIVASSASTQAFAANDSLEVTLAYPSVMPGVHPMHCRLACLEDEDTTNNDVRFPLAVAALARSIVVNEIMYEPDEGRAEYLELFNRSSAPIDLAGWCVADGPASKKNRTLLALSPSGPHQIAPGAFVIVADDSSIFDELRRGAANGQSVDVIIRSTLSLNNTGEDVILLDASGTVIDDVSYLPSWHLMKGSNTGRSLERINPGLAGSDGRNWSSSVAPRGGTPGARNSIYSVALPTDAMLALSPNPFSPDGDGREDACSISYALQSTAMTLRVRIFDSAGRLVRTLANNEPAAARGTLIWNGRDDRDMRVRMGIYIVFLEALDAQGVALRTLKAAAVVATRLE